MLFHFGFSSDVNGQCSGSGLKTRYAVDAAATLAANTIAVNGGTLNLVYNLVSGRAITAIGTQFTVPVVYSDLNNTASLTNHQWDNLTTNTGFTDFATSISRNYISIMPNATPGSTGNIYNGLPSNNTTNETCPATASVDRAINGLLATNKIDLLGNFNLTVGNYPAPPSGVSVNKDTLVTISRYNLRVSTGGTSVSAAYRLKPVAQTDVYSDAGAFSANNMFDISYGTTIPFNYTGFWNGNNNENATNAGTRGVMLYGSVTYCSNPLAVGKTNTSQPNPGSTTQSSDVASNFAGTDPTSSIITRIIITAFPTNATSISINGVVYTSLAAISNAYPNGITTNAAGVPTVAIRVDPNFTGAGSVSIPFNVVNNDGGVSLSPSTVIVPFTSSTLPVTLINFTATNEKCTVKLNWESAQEDNFAYYQVEKSLDGVSFTGEMKITSKGSNSQYKALIDNINTDKLYLRLKLVDINGTFKYSEVLKININCDKVGIIQMNPNPAKSTVKLQLNTKSGKYTIDVISQGGLVLLRKVEQIVNGQVVEINGLEKLTKGMYYVRVSNQQGTIFYEKLMVD